MYRKILVGILIVGALSLALIAITHIFTSTQQETFNLDQQKLFLDYYRFVGFGFIIALLGVMVPHLLADEKYRNQRFKESKGYYSEAKTEIIYLKEEIAQLDYIDAIKKVKEVHQRLHHAETYPNELKQHLQWLSPYQDTWVDRNYWQITLIRKMLNKNIEKWNGQKQVEKEQKIQKVLDKIEVFFGHHNEHWYKAIYKDNKKPSEVNKAKRLQEDKLKKEFEGLPVPNIV